MSIGGRRSCGVAIYLLMLCRDPAERGVGCFEQAAYLGHGRCPIAHGQRDLPLLLPGELPGPTALPPPCSGGVQSGLGPFADQRPLELRQGSHDVEDQHPPGGGSVDGVLEALESVFENSLRRPPWPPR